ncbi:protein of unknown function [Paraburkholderia kururiensis]
MKSYSNIVRVIVWMAAVTMIVPVIVAVAFVARRMFVLVFVAVVVFFDFDVA